LGCLNVCLNQLSLLYHSLHCWNVVLVSILPNQKRKLESSRHSILCLKLYMAYITMPFKSIILHITPLMYFFPGFLCFSSCIKAIVLLLVVLFSRNEQPVKRSGELKELMSFPKHTACIQGMTWALENKIYWYWQILTCIY
jgi:hypothetical protein